MTLVQRSQVTEANSVGAVRGDVPLSLALKHGGVLRTQVKYELAGPDGAPLLIIAGGISANRHVAWTASFPEPGWWESQRAVLLNRYRTVAIDWLGADGDVDLPIDPADQAQAIGCVLDHLNINAVAFVGASYGAMVGMHLAASIPQRIGSLLTISASARPHPYASACRSLQRRALELGETAGATDSGVALARAMAMLTYRTPDEFAERFDQRPRVQDGRVQVPADGYLEAQGARHCRRMSARAYRRLSESIDLHWIDPATIAVPLTTVGVDQDGLVPASDVQALADAVPKSRFHLVRSSFGHDAFLKEDGQIGAILRQFLESLEHAQ